MNGIFEHIIVNAKPWVVSPLATVAAFPLGLVCRGALYIADQKSREEAYAYISGDYSRLNSSKTLAITERVLTYFGAFALGTSMIALQAYDDTRRFTKVHVCSPLQKIGNFLEVVDYKIGYNTFNTFKQGQNTVMVAGNSITKSYIDIKDFGKNMLAVCGHKLVAGCIDAADCCRLGSYRNYTLRKLQQN